MSKLSIPTFEAIEVDPETALLPLTTEDAPEMHEAIAANTDHLSRFMRNWSNSTLDDVVQYCEAVEEETKAGKVAAYKTVHRDKFVGNATLEVVKSLGMPELLCWVAEDVGQQGIDTRVVTGIRDRYFEAGVKHIGMFVNSHNVNSRRVAQKAGAGLETPGLALSFLMRRLPHSMTRFIGDELWVMNRGGLLNE